MAPLHPRENKTTYVINPDEPNETTRLLAFDEAITKGITTLLPNSIDLTQVASILDLACGPGAWALQAAQTYPEIEVVGVDISRSMIRYANGRADLRDLGNVSFQEMDILQPLEFPDASFDVVTARLLHAFMSKDTWPKLLQECVRVTRPGGHICLTESEWGWTNGVACEDLNSRGTRGLWLTGHGFYPGGKLIGIPLMLTKFLGDAGLQDIEKQPYVIDYSYGAEAHESMCQMFTFGYELLFPFLQQTTGLSREEFDNLHQQTEEEMQDENFRALHFFLRAWGRKPE
jgi:ubiquinone/menaquinone biosynthesis C-methylase UbiE